MMDTISDIVFAIFNSWHMAIVCFIVSGLNLYKSFDVGEKIWPRRLKALNWGLLSLTFFLIYFLDVPSVVQRSWLRFAFGLLALGEIAYYGDVLVEIYWRIKDALFKAK